MRRIKSILLVAFAAVMTLTSFSAVSAAKVAKTKNVVLKNYREVYYSGKKTSAKNTDYKCKVTGNGKKYIQSEFSNYEDSWQLRVQALKKTNGKKPTVTIYYRSPGSGNRVTVGKYAFTVKSPGTVNFKNVRINKNTSKKVTLKNPSYKDYRFKIADKKTAKIDPAYYADADKVSYNVKGLKKGDTTVKVYLKGTKFQVGSFKITVGNFPAKIKSRYKTISLKYNGHGNSAYMSKSHISLKSILKDKRAGAKYTVRIDDSQVASTVGDDLIYAAGKGSTRARIYEKTASAKKTKLGTITIKVSRAKMAYVADENKAFYNDGIFGHGDFIEYLSLVEKNNTTLNMKGTIERCLINNTITGSHFKASAYKITYSSSNPKVASVNADGVVTAVGYGDARIYYTIAFSDNSKYEDYCPVSVYDE